MSDLKWKVTVRLTNGESVSGTKAIIGENGKKFLQVEDNDSTRDGNYEIPWHNVLWIWHYRMKETNG
jgi:methionine-rich copper-binding protein CopC